MATIARRAGMSTSSVYYHFRSKDTILLELLDRAAEGLREALEAVTPGETARRVADAYVAWMLPDPRRAVLLLGAGVGGTADVEACRRRHNVALTRTVACLLRLDHKDGAESVGALVEATALIGLFGELARAYLRDGLPEADLLPTAERLIARLLPRNTASAG